ncbi:amidohydrolase family protein [Bacillus sp. FJAT-49705]|uniref:Amidohydrolase family protein n=1 Tax=Cytobacillus citreus TaxID=2833586 RepID=A0ABS5NY63_9BACI|nr:amidohydrolase family protein [Cytobacillus citreus]MBS4192329.1 amidohydrolase family protein [Cytobacillus citreus]
MKIAYLVNQLFDGRSPGYKQDVAILVEDGIIQDVIGKYEVPSHYLIEDLGNLFVLPGLIDCHVHLVWNGSQDPNSIMVHEFNEKTAARVAEHARETLMHGVTTVRDAGGDYKAVFPVRDLIEENVIRGSRILASGNPIMMTGGHCHDLGFEIDGPHEARKGTRKMMKSGADLIKVMAGGGCYGKWESPDWPQLTVEELSAIAEEAHHGGRKVAAHAEGLQSIINVVEAGVDTIEHGNMMTAEVAKVIADKKIMVVPTIATFYLLATLGEEKGVPDYAIRKAQEILSGSYKVIQYAKDYGIQLAAGTDCGAPGFPHGALVFELEVLVHAGLTPLEALRTATSNASKACGIEQNLGTIESGKIADFIGIKNDPLISISALREVDTVVKNGNLEKRHGFGKETEKDFSTLNILNSHKVLETK